MNRHSIKAYENSWEYLSDELRWLNLLIQRNMLKLNRPPQNKNYDEFMGLFLSDEEINKILDDLNNDKSQSPFASDVSELQKLDDSIKELEAWISQRQTVSLNQGVHLSLPRLSYLFHLTPFEEDVIIFCLARTLFA